LRVIRFRRLIRQLRRSTAGVAMVEFALTAPFFLGAGLWGLEVANYALTNMKVSQLAAHIADNASRIGDTSTLQNRKIYEEDINDLLLGANLQGGQSLDFFAHGRAFISSLEVWDAAIHTDVTHSDDDQFIHWQRCMGGLVVPSTYGTQNDVIPAGMGPTGAEVLALSDAPVIFVELQYDYQPLFSSMFITSTRITSTSSFIVRDNRDQSTIYKRNAATPEANCT
jgi:hypothetical protein